MSHNNSMLKYLFTAEFKDGSVLEQNPEDKSAIEPEKRSAFYDVMQREGELKKFTLKGPENTVSVDLEDGHFELNGVQFLMHDPIKRDLGEGKVKIIPLKDFRLIFFRNHTHHYMQDGVTELDHFIIYRIGWQCTVDGENVQRILQID